MPQVYIVYTSFKKVNGTTFVPGYSFGSYLTAFDRVGRAITNTLLIPGVSLVVIVFFAALIAYITVRRRNVFTGIADTISMVPYIVPGSVVGITLLIAFNKPPILLSGTMLIMGHWTGPQTSSLYYPFFSGSPPADSSECGGGFHESWGFQRSKPSIR